MPRRTRKTTRRESLQDQQQIVRAFVTAACEWNGALPAFLQLKRLRDRVGPDGIARVFESLGYRAEEKADAA